jgi:hypothetical protein
MSAEKIVPAVAINERRCFAIYCYVNGFVALDTMTCCGVKFYKTNETKVCAIRKPKASVVWVKKQTGIDSITILILKGFCHNYRLGVLEVWGVRVKSLVPHCQDLTPVSASETTTCGTICNKITVADFYGIRSRTTSGANSAFMPSPSVGRY